MKSTNYFGVSKCGNLMIKIPVSVKMRCGVKLECVVSFFMATKKGVVSSKSMEALRKLFPEWDGTDAGFAFVSNFKAKQIKKGTS